QHQIGLPGIVHRCVTVLLQNARDDLTVAEVHLAAVALDIDLLAHSFAPKGLRSYRIRSSVPTWQDMENRFNFDRDARDRTSVPVHIEHRECRCAVRSRSFSRCFHTKFQARLVQRWAMVLVRFVALPGTRWFAYRSRF